jgi:hypothetical protein
VDHDKSDRADLGRLCWRPSRSRRFGIVAHSLVGLVAGALSGYFLQVQALTVVTGSGSMNQPRIADVFVIEGVTAAVVGGIAMAAIGMLLENRKTKA